MDVMQVYEDVAELRGKLEQAAGLVNLAGNVVADGVEVSKYAESLARVEGFLLKWVKEDEKELDDSCIIV